jgi:hypothetical protein
MTSIAFNTEWRTFYGKNIKISELSHQHMSNIIHYYALVATICNEPWEIQMEIKERFGGILLPYHPLISFTSEIDYLVSQGYTTGEPNADIVVNGKWIGKIKYS